MTPLQEVCQILQEAKADIMLKLQGHEHEAVTIMISTRLNDLINRTGHIVGAPVELSSLTARKFGPVKRFFGDEIVRPQAVTAQTLEPGLTDKEIFLNKVNTLQNEFGMLQPEQIIKSFSRSQDQKVIRGVALRAGLEDAKTAVINTDFIGRIKEGLKNKQVLANSLQNLNNKLKLAEDVNYNLQHPDENQDFLQLLDPGDPSFAPQHTVQPINPDTQGGEEPLGDFSGGDESTISVHTQSPADNNAIEQTEGSTAKVHDPEAHKTTKKGKTTK